ncbi:MAG: hypothetical protein NTW51_02290 [Cyanobacteria bacterium]|nr:hypothetical protein [Cyanobacteriota bacterium]
MATKGRRGGAWKSLSTQGWLPLLTARLSPGFGGVVLFGVALLGLPFSAHHLSQFEALNRELGKLCSQPPPQAHNVCRLHARLLSSL